MTSLNDVRNNLVRNLVFLRRNTICVLLYGIQEFVTHNNRPNFTMWFGFWEKYESGSRFRMCKIWRFAEEPLS